MTAPDQASPTGQDTPPTCYRHPGRETWVSCVRCGRHACPDCLRDAAVGQQCVDCVRGTGQGGQRARAAKTVFGGRPSRSATVTWTLMAINILLYLVELARPSLASDWWMLGYAQYYPGGPMHGVAAGEWYRLITSAFLPGDRQPRHPGHRVQHVGAVHRGTRPRAAARQGPLPCRVPAQRGRRQRALLLSGAAERAGPRRLRRRSSACSAPGSWPQGSWASTAAGSCC